MLDIKQKFDILEFSREPTHQGEILLEDFLLPFNISQTKLANDLSVSFKTVDEIINHKRSVTPDISLRLSKYFGTSPQLWLGLQMDYDLYKTYNNKNVKSYIEHIVPLEVKI